MFGRQHGTRESGVQGSTQEAASLFPRTRQRPETCPATALERVLPRASTRGRCAREVEQMSSDSVILAGETSLVAAQLVEGEQQRLCEHRAA